MSDKIFINPSVPATALPVAIRQLMLMIGGFVLIARFIQDRDMAGLSEWLMSADFPIFVAAVMVVGSAGYGQLRSLWDLANLAKLGRIVPNSIAEVKEPTPPPAVKP